MNRELIKGAIAECVDTYFNTLIQEAVRAAGSKSELMAEIQAVQFSLVQAIMKAKARVYPDQEFAARLSMPGIDIGYRHVLVSSPESEDEWIAAVSISLDELDEATCKIIARWHDQDALRLAVGATEAKRLVLFVVRNEQAVTLNPLAIIAAEDTTASLVFTPCVFSWSIPEASGAAAMIGHVTITQARLEQAHRLLAVIDCPHTARLMDEHMRSSAPAVMH